MIFFHFVIFRFLEIILYVDVVQVVSDDRYCVEGGTCWCPKGGTTEKGTFKGVTSDKG